MHQRHSQKCSSASGYKERTPFRQVTYPAWLRKKAQGGVSGLPCMAFLSAESYERPKLFMAKQLSCNASELMEEQSIALMNEMHGCSDGHTNDKRWNGFRIVKSAIFKNTSIVRRLFDTTHRYNEPHQVRDLQLILPRLFWQLPSVVRGQYRCFRHQGLR